MRKSLLTGLLGVALLTAPVLFSTKSDAANPLRPKAPAAATPRTSPRAPLPNYDIRLAGRGEFADTDVSTKARAQSALASGSAALRSRASAVESFRASLGEKGAEHLRAEVNESGAMKNFFVDGAALTGPQADMPDNVARGFLKSRAALFALGEAGVDGLKLNREDGGEGATFLDYVQTVNGIKVFEGDVRVAVGRSGEVLSVREGFLVNGQTVGSKPRLTEAQGIARAFEHAGRSVVPSFAETRARAMKSESAEFANPIDASLENVLSELNVVRVGDAARLAWHVTAEVGPEEWYDITVDANTGELLTRYNLYVFEAQGTVYTEDP
ncbi:MAG TPA: hypothetical protein VM936_13630, partial [Pyrinomonadaceae bacterium]|nr:hypothetical protein [Pyrinomonadaceae bacterium]